MNIGDKVKLHLKFATEVFNDAYVYMTLQQGEVTYVCDKPLGKTWGENAGKIPVEVTFPKLGLSIQCDITQIEKDEAEQ